MSEPITPQPPKLDVDDNHETTASPAVPATDLVTTSSATGVEATSPVVPTTGSVVQCVVSYASNTVATDVAAEVAAVPHVSVLRNMANGTDATTDEPADVQIPRPPMVSNSPIVPVVGHPVVDSPAPVSVTMRTLPPISVVASSSMTIPPTHDVTNIPPTTVKRSSPTPVSDAQAASSIPVSRGSASEGLAAPSTAHSAAPVSVLRHHASALEYGEIPQPSAPYDVEQIEHVDVDDIEAEDLDVSKRLRPRFKVELYPWSYGLFNYILIVTARRNMSLELTPRSR